MQAWGTTDAAAAARLAATGEGADGVVAGEAAFEEVFARVRFEVADAETDGRVVVGVVAMGAAGSAAVCAIASGEIAVCGAG
jgi:hypothetical protein